MAELPDIDFTLEFPYTRTTGPVIGPYLTGLRDGRVLGMRVGDRVICPPVEFDPDTGATVGPENLVEVGPAGTVEAWTWVAEPTSKHPLDHPFAFAQIKLDGADTTMLHAVDAGSIDAMSTGMRVVVRYNADRVGSVTDIHFVPGEDAADAPSVDGDGEDVAIMEHVIGVRIREPLQPHRVTVLEGLLERKILGQRSPADGKVHVPSRGYDAINRVPMLDAEYVEVADRGTVTSYTEITPVQYHGQTETEPYIRCSVLLDGADTTVGGIDVRDIPVDEFRIGMRLQMIWKDEISFADPDNRGFGLSEEVYDRWEPTGEPDVDPELVKEHNF
ncbi:MAG: OB-fold domain-containing protein [Actinomycetota bacterium]